MARDKEMTAAVQHERKRVGESDTLATSNEDDILPFSYYLFVFCGQVLRDNAGEGEGVRAQQNEIAALQPLSFCSFNRTISATT